MRRIAIIGGGPAGAHCAAVLARSGFEVTVFEPRHRHEKACGGGVPARGMETFPFLDDPRLPARLVRHCIVDAPSGRRAEIPLREPLWIFSRADLHQFLLQRAVASGALHEALRVVDFKRLAAGSWILRATGAASAPETHGPYEFLIAADGAAGIARRRLAGGVPATALTQGVGAYLPGLSEDSITLKFFTGLHGYLWIFPRLDHSSAGICGRLGERPAAELLGLMERFLSDRYGNDLVTRSSRYSGLIPDAPAEVASEPRQGDGWAVVGDCGRMVDPLTREGIHFAMLSGELLAAALASGRPDRYAATWAAGPAREFAWAARHASGFFAPHFIERLVALCRRSSAVRRVVADLISGRQPYRTLKRRLILTAPAIGWQAALGPGTPPSPLTSARGIRNSDH